MKNYRLYKDEKATYAADGERVTAFPTDHEKEIDSWIDSGEDYGEPITDDEFTQLTEYAECKNCGKLYCIFGDCDC